MDKHTPVLGPLSLYERQIRDESLGGATIAELVYVARDTTEDVHRRGRQIVDMAARIADLEAQLAAEREKVDRLERYGRILTFLHRSGPTPEGFAGDEFDCYEHAAGLMTDDDDSLEDDDPRWFEGWLQMIEAAMKREALSATEPAEDPAP